MALLAAGIYKSIYGLRCNNFKGAFSRSTCSYEAVSRVSRINHKIPVRRRPSRRRIYSSRADFSLGAPARALQCLCSAEESEGVEVGIGRARGKTRLEKEKPTRELFPRYRAQRPACNVRVSAAGVSGSLALRHAASARQMRFRGFSRLSAPTWIRSRRTLDRRPAASGTARRRSLRRVSARSRLVRTNNKAADPTHFLPAGSPRNYRAIVSQPGRESPARPRPFFRSIMFDARSGWK